MTRAMSPSGNTVTATTTPKRKPGRPFKKRTPAAMHAGELPIAETQQAELSPGVAPPPTIPFRSFKKALSLFKDQETIPARLDQTVWSNQLYSTSLRDTLYAYRFLGLVNDASAPTSHFRLLVEAFGTRAWPGALRDVIERAYRPLLAAHASTLTSGGLLQALRDIYGTRQDKTRKCANFFIHAAREAALDTDTFLSANAKTRWRTNNRSPESPPTFNRPDGKSGSPIEVIEALIARLPQYDAGWPDDVKRHWFSAYVELVQRLK